MRCHAKRLISLLTLSSLLALPVFLSDRVVAQAPPTGMNKINHVIWIIQENRSFDNYFGTYPGADGIPSGTCLPMLPGSTNCVQPFHMPPGQPALDLAHDWDTIHAAYNHGNMDGFVWAEGTNLTMAYYDERDIPNYWIYARHFTLCDRFFSSQMGYSLPNHTYTVAAQSGGLIVNVANLKVDTVSGKSGPAHIQGREIDFKRSALIRLQESFDDGRVEVGPRAFRDDILGLQR